MQAGARDFRSGQSFDHAVFFDEAVDIHHVFPSDWCKKQGIPASVYDPIINKTLLSSKTNRIIGGSAPSKYLKKLVDGSKGVPPIEPGDLDEYLRTHLIDPELLRSDSFTAFFEARQQALVELVARTTRSPIYRGKGTNEPESDVPDQALDAADDLALAAE